jgi:hypothetical protein
MEVRPLYSLYLITHTGHYIAVQGARPTHDTQLLEQLASIVESIRPGRGKYYELHIARVTEDWQPTDADFAEIKRLQREL